MKANNVIIFPEGNIVRKIPRPEDELGNEFAINKKIHIINHFSIYHIFFLIIFI